MTKITIILLSILLVISIAVFSGCVEQRNVPIVDNHSINISVPESTQELKKFSSASEIRNFLEDAAASPQVGDSGFERMMKAEAFEAPPMDEAVAEEIAAVRPPVPSSTPVVRGASEYSTTNIQVESVDEADFVKNDGKYIYVLVQNKLLIVDSYPPENAMILSETTIPGTPRNMFVNGNQLVVFSEDYHEVLFYPEYDFIPRKRYAQKTSTLVYDISNREKPVLASDYNLTGNYFQSRMIGNYIYFIVKDYVYHYNNFIDVPTIRHASEEILRPDVYYFDNPEQNYVFHTIASIDLANNDINAKSFLMGYSDNLYVSENNIYITYRKNLPYRYYQQEQKEEFYKIVVPLLPSDAQNKINAIKENNVSLYEKWDRISSVLEETYNRMGEKEKRDLFNRIGEAVEEYEEKILQERDQTIIQKIKINKGEITYDGRGKVPGMLLNQFSMDEHDGYFRVATTSQFWMRNKGSIQFNNVYVMDSDLKITGSIEKIASDEQIYSTRFIGERLYMVTFKQIDPLFVIDLSDPANPEILGKLKIPGFSDYLHPYDKNHIIGIGKETGTNRWGDVSIKGVKLALFNVSDVEKPEQVDKYEIGEAGTDSEALRDHKAFLFDKNKNLLVIPIREVKEENRYDRNLGQRVWQGAYVFNVTTNGFKLRGTVTHVDYYEEEYYYWNSPYAVRRALYMDDVLYTISARKILMNDLEDISMVNSIDLPFEEYNYQKYR